MCFWSASTLLHAVMFSSSTWPHHVSGLGEEEFGMMSWRRAQVLLPHYSHNTHSTWTVPHFVCSSALCWFSLFPASSFSFVLFCSLADSFNAAYNFYPPPLSLGPHLSSDLFSAGSETKFSTLPYLNSRIVKIVFYGLISLETQGSLEWKLCFMFLVVYVDGVYT